MSSVPLYIALYIALLILQPFRHFTYVTTHSPTLPSLYLRHSSCSNPSVALPTSQFNLQPFFRLSYVTSSSLNSPGEPPMRHNTSFDCKQKSGKLHFEVRSPRWLRWQHVCLWFSRSGVRSPAERVNFHLKIFNLGARRGGDVHFLIARLYITVLD